MRAREKELSSVTSTGAAATPLVEVFQQLYKTYIKWAGAGKKHKFHEQKLTDTLGTVPRNMLVHLENFYNDVPGIKSSAGATLPGG